MREEGIVKDPLIVDEEDLVILDGMHRFESLKRLGCRFAPCCLLDYMSPQIRVGSWYRVFTIGETRSVAQDILSTMKLDGSQHQLEGIGKHDADAIIGAHVIPSRPLEINVPRSPLTDTTISSREADEKLGELLADRRIDRRPPGSVIDERRYDEELLLFFR